MKQDLDRLMEERGLDALWVTGAANHNSAMVYFTGIANITKADLIKKRKETPVLFHYPMERDEAARTNLPCRNLNDYKLNEILRQASGSQTRAGAMRVARMLHDLGVEGRVAVEGKTDLASTYALLKELQEHAPFITLVADGDDPILLRARSTKSPEEIQKIRRLGDITVSILAETAEFLTSHVVRGDQLAQSDGTPLTIGDVKAFIRRRITEKGAEVTEGLIFAQGRDAGIPHSTGNDGAPVRIGKPIIFDLFPCEAGGGYFYDVTRTWCLGHASEELERMHQQVLRAYDEAKTLARPGTPCRELQTRVCRFFMGQGHPTLLDDPQTEKGYVHGLGHGVGLDIHESPSFSHAESNHDVLEPGVVFTIEPGLYYPGREIGIRLEDTLWLRPDGTAEVLAAYPTDLILKVRNRKPFRTAKAVPQKKAKTLKRKK